MQKKTIEIWVGILMLLAILAFVFMSLRVSGLNTTDFSGNTYDITANFTDVGGLKARGAVRIAGVQVGMVEAVKLNPETYEAHVVMSMQKTIHIPQDSSASITSSGILGDNYISITPGFATQNLADGGQIVTTYAATSLTSLISTFMSGAKKPTRPNPP